MKALSLTALVLLLAASGWILLSLLEVSAPSGVYSSYSSLRADELGTKVIYDSLARIPGLQVERSFVPWKLFTVNGAAVFYLGLSEREWHWMPTSVCEEFERVASRGNRVILALFAAHRLPRTRQESEPPVERRWGVRVQVPEQIPRTIRFTYGKEWMPLEGNSVLERPFGKGSIVLVSNASLFINGSQARHPHGDLVAKLVGERRRVVFEESHLGLVEAGSTMKLALRYRMHGFLAGFLLWVALYVWKNASSFPPRMASGEAPLVTGRTSLSGLETLLRRNIAEKDLARVAFTAWRKTAERSYRREEIDRAARVMDTAAGPAAEVLERVRAELPRRAKGAE